MTHYRVPLRFFSALWDKMFSAEIFDTPPPRPSHPKISSLPEIFRNTAQNGSPAKFLGTARQKKSTKKRNIILLSIKNFDTRNQWHHRGFPYEFFRNLRQKRFDRKLWYTPASFSSTNLFATGNFPKHSIERFLCKVFFTLRDKKFDENRDLFLLSINFYDTRNQWHTRGFLYDFFRHCETKSVQPKFLILPPSISSTNFFATGNFPKHSTERFLCKVFLHCETKNSTKIVTYSV